MGYIKSDFKKDIESLTTEGFTLKAAIQAYLFVRQQSDRTETITLSYRDYSPHGFYIDGISVDISFKAVEEVINSLLEKYNVQNRYGSTTIQKNLANVPEVDYSKLGIEINSDSTFDVVRHEINIVIDSGAKPFFAAYNSLDRVTQSIRQMSEDDLSVFISGIVGIKIPLIKRITQSDDFIEELRKRQLFYSGEALRYPQYFKDHDKVFYELFKEDLQNLK